MWSGAAKPGFNKNAKAICEEKHMFWEAASHFKFQGLGAEPAKASAEHQIHYEINGV